MFNPEQRSACGRIHRKKRQTVHNTRRGSSLQARRILGSELLWNQALATICTPALHAAVEWLQPQTRKSCCCRGTELFRLQLHQDSSYTSHVSGHGRWRYRSALECRGFGYPLGVIRTAEVGKSGIANEHNCYTFRRFEAMAVRSFPIRPTHAASRSDWDIHRKNVWQGRLGGSRHRTCHVLANACCSISGGCLAYLVLLANVAHYRILGCGSLHPLAHKRFTCHPVVLLSRLF